VGYMMKDMLDKAGSTDTAKLLATLDGLKSDTIVGPVSMRALDHQSTMGAWVGETTVKDKKGTMKNWKYEDGAKYQFSEDEVKAARKQ
jgi:branched-chain amino acid transport system substrate-binding protein